MSGILIYTNLRSRNMKKITVIPTNSRTQYYLAQTYDCLNMKPQAIAMYSIRAENCLGFQEERFLAMMKIAEPTGSRGQLLRSERTKQCLKSGELFNSL